VATYTLLTLNYESLKYVRKLSVWQRT